MTPQQKTALDMANEMRMDKAKLRGEIGALPYYDALRLLADHLEAEGAVIGAFRLAEALSACPKLGAVSAGRFVKRIGAVTGDRRVRDLTAPQRAALVVALRDPVASGTRGARAAQAAITDAIAPKRPRATPIARRPAPTRRPSNDRAERLFAAIREHRRNVASPTLPAEAFATADEDLYRTAREIMGAGQAEAA